ncbi:T9SS type A sorting domain-containing protein [Winogradskyella jejuensis]|uniref:Por secretion system C-terminal sorting domain-containing protein n=1 Tax=Winogradskyella jejuensis TaxID=1089305 RepID=A0A1M5SY95_9FLAO|nr:T9SS type A sorting domain-containing protein [Winogradskyella jejuensis]SHH43445.1 Por secretion system C-terminal sorting domain-containing protein [Winogradskyella jejuensis]
MKKITLLCFSIVTSFGFSQVITSGVIDLTTSGPNVTRSVKFDINTSTDIVTMTLVFPDNTWLGIGMSQGTENDIARFQNMGDLDDDAVIGRNTGIEDRNMPSGTGQPALDDSGDIDDEWIVTSNTQSGGVRTLIATRARDTFTSNDSEDTVFPNTTPFDMPFIFAYGGSSFGYHGSGNYGGTMASFSVLSNDDFQLNPVRFTISPNPSNRDLNVGINYNSSRAYNLEVYDVLGKQIYRGQLTKDNNSIDASNWRRGVYLIKLSSDEATQTKRFIKQ